MKKDPYQTFKPLNTEAFAGLLESIKLLGILQPVITDEKKFKGIIDGHHRYKAAKSLGWKDDDIPYTIVTGLSEDAKRLLSRSLNIARRQLSSADRRQAIIDQIKETPHLSDRKLAKELGVSNGTVSSLRRQLVDSDELCNVTQITGEDGITRRRPIVVRNPSRYEAAVLRDNPDTIKMMQDKELTNVTYTQRLVNLSAQTESVSDNVFDENRIKLIHADLRDGLPMIEDNSVDVIIMDAPYERKHLELYEHIGSIGQRILKDGGSALVMAGQAIVPEAITAIHKHLEWHWLITLLYTRKPLLAHKRLYANSKPVLWFSKGQYSGKIQADVIQAPESGEEWKEYHPHGQSVEVFKTLVEAFCPENGVVADLTCGASTTGVAVVLAGRNRGYMGVDIDEQHIETSRLRIKAALVEAGRKT